MTIQTSFNLGNNKSPFGFLGPLLILVLFFGTLFFLAKGLFWLLSYAAPVLLIATLIMDHNIIVDYLKWVWKLLMENTLMGVIVVLMTAFGFPFVAGYLFFKALARRSVKNIINEQQKRQNTFDDYEEVEDTDFLELPTLPEEPMLNTHSAKGEKYDDLFK